MANTTTANKPKTTKTSTTTKKTTAKSTESPEIAKDKVIETAATKKNATATKKEYRVKKDLDPNMIVSVKSGYQGVLVYKSKRTQEIFEWDSFGSEQDMELQELKNAKNSAKDFFVNNWFLIDNPEVLEYLGVTQYYKYALNFEAFNELFEKDVKEISEIISNLSDGQKKSLAYRAKQLIEDGVIDSIKTINALEKGLSVELINRD